MELDAKQELLEIIAERFRALGDPTRLRLLLRLREGAANVTVLAQVSGLSRSAVSRHLGILRHVGLIRVCREGTNAHYEMKDPQVFEMCEIVCAGILRHHTELHAALGLGAEDAG